MDKEGIKTAWYKKRKYQFLIFLLVALILLSFLPTPPHAPLSKTQVSLNRAIDYFAHNYNYTIGLILEYPGSHTFWIYSDNYLAALALSRYGPGNSSTSNFALALHSALGVFAATFPSALAQSQYTALNSTKASFNCSSPYLLSWTKSNGSFVDKGGTTVETVSNDGNPACASQNYADLIFLEALHYHRVGNSSAASNLYHQGALDFDGVGIVDVPFKTLGSGSFNSYQTYKVALYIYAASCLGVQSTDTNFANLVSILLSQQDNKTGGFYTGYYSLTNPSTPHPNTETTALAALALEQLIRPSTSC